RPRLPCCRSGSRLARHETRTQSIGTPSAQGRPQGTARLPAQGYSDGRRASFADRFVAVPRMWIGGCHRGPAGTRMGTAAVIARFDEFMDRALDERANDYNVVR